MTPELPPMPREYGHIWQGRYYHERRCSLCQVDYQAWAGRRLLLVCPGKG